MTSVVILCGGEGSRLSGTVSGPKCLVPLGLWDRPVVEWVMDWVDRRTQEKHRFVLCCGPFMAEFHEVLGRRPRVHFVAEPNGRFGTGGAVAAAVRAAPEWFMDQDVVPVLNGDTVLMGGAFPILSEAYAVVGNDAINDHPGVAFRAVPKPFLLEQPPWIAWSLEDRFVGRQVPNDLLYYWDIGTPAGLSAARDRWPSR